MSRWTTAALCLGTFFTLGRGAFAQETNEEKRDKKLKSTFLSKAPWITDYDQARAESKKSGNLIFGYFTRSYAP